MTSGVNLQDLESTQITLPSSPIKPILATICDGHASSSARSLSGLAVLEQNS